MGHGCHDCGCPNGCECPETLAFREKMRVERGDPRPSVASRIRDMDRMTAQIKAATYDFPPVAWPENLNEKERAMLTASFNRLVDACERLADEV